MPEYVHAHGPRELTVAGTTRDRELAAKAADGRTNWNLADAAPVPHDSGE